jgi:hypothetical protein
VDELDGLMCFVSESFDSLTSALGALRGGFRSYRGVARDTADSEVLYGKLNEDIGQILVDVTVFFHSYVQLQDIIMGIRKTLPGRAVLDELVIREKLLERRYWAFKELKESVWNLHCVLRELRGGC